MNWNGLIGYGGRGGTGIGIERWSCLQSTQKRTIEREQSQVGEVGGKSDLLSRREEEYGPIVGVQIDRRYQAGEIGGRDSIDAAQAKRPNEPIRIGCLQQKIRCAIIG